MQRKIIKICFLLCLMSLSSVGYAASPKFEKQLREHWIKQLASEQKDASGNGVVQSQQIESAVDLAKRTLVFVQKSKALPSLSKKLERLAQKWNRGEVKPEQYESFYYQVRGVRRQILFAHPDLDFDKILINRTPPTTYSHNADQYQGGMSRSGPGLTVLSDWKSSSPKATAILKGKLPEGSTRSPDLHYDAEKVVFGYSDYTLPGVNRYFLYEAAIDGSWVRQLTGTKRDKFETTDNRVTAIIEDNDPCYLPDGGIAFVSTRSQSYGRCHGTRYAPASVLYRCDKDGNAIRQLSFNNENEYEPSVLNDGRLIFTRWEYTNRHEMLFHMLWWCNPDGTKISHYYGNDTLYPMMIVEATAIPETTKVVATVAGHHSYSTGAIVIIDTEKGENGEAPVTKFTPETPYPESEGWASIHYRHPYPLSEDLFLVSRANHRICGMSKCPPANDRAIYLIDSLGGREFIYEDPTVASVSPIPIQKRKTPPAIPSSINLEGPQEGTLFVQNAYITRNDPEKKIKPGSIKAIRVNAIGVQPRRKRNGCSKTVAVEIPKKVLGTAPVSPEGAAFFKAPSGTALQLQLLDETGRAILTEKSFFYLQPGENRGCVGCHEPTGTSPSPSSAAKLRSMKPATLKPPAGPNYPGGLSFMRTVQPVLDRYCIRCHGLDATQRNKNGEKLPSLVHDGQGFPQSYTVLSQKGKHWLGNKGYMKKYNISRPYEFYAYGNPVSQMLIDNHSEVDMDRESLMRIIEWMDLNAQCFGDLFPNKLESRRIDAQALTALRQYVKEVFGEKVATQPERALINTVQVDESRILMMPLPKASGGWGQMPGYASKTDTKYTTMKRLVEASIIKSSNENDRGWEPTLLSGAGDDGFIRERQELTQRILGRPIPNISPDKYDVNGPLDRGGRQNVRTQTLMKDSKQ